MNFHAAWIAASAPPLNEQTNSIGDNSYDTARETAWQPTLAAKRRNTFPTATGQMPPSIFLKAVRFAEKGVS